MTRQVKELVVVNGQPYRAAELPLEYHSDCAARLGEFRNRFTACRRGYVGNWHIEAGELRLDDIFAGHLPGHKSILARCFPEFCPGPTVADWFTGWLHLSQRMEGGGGITHSGACSMNFKSILRFGPARLSKESNGRCS